MQAWQIGGIIAKIPLSAVMRPISTELWLQGFARSELPRMNISDKDEPDYCSAPHCSPHGIDELLDGDDNTGAWETYVPGRKPAREYTMTLGRSLPPLLAALQTAASPNREPPSTGEPSSSRGVEGPNRPISPPGSWAAENAPLVPQLNATHGAPAAYQARSPTPAPGQAPRGYVVVIQGENPWVFDQR